MQNSNQLLKKLSPDQLKFLKVVSFANPNQWTCQELANALKEKISIRYQQIILDSTLSGSDLIFGDIDAFIKLISEELKGENIPTKDSMKLKSFFKEVLALKEHYDKNPQELEEIQFQLSKNEQQIRQQSRQDQNMLYILNQDQNRGDGTEHYPQQTANIMSGDQTQQHRFLNFGDNQTNNIQSQNIIQNQTNGKIKSEDTTQSMLDTAKYQSDTTKSQLDTTKYELDVTKTDIDTFHFKNGHPFEVKIAKIQVNEEETDDDQQEEEKQNNNQMPAQQPLQQINQQPIQNVNLQQQNVQQNNINQNQNQNQNIQQQTTNPYTQQNVQRVDKDKEKTKDIVVDIKEFNITISISQTRDQDQQNYDPEQNFNLINRQDPREFKVNITRQANNAFIHNYTINSQDCSRDHVQVQCNNEIQFFLDQIRGRNGTFVKCQNQQKIKRGMLLQVGNIFITFEEVSINQNSLFFRVKAFNLTQQDNPIEVEERMSLGQTLTVSRKQSTFTGLSNLFQNDNQLSRKHGEFHFKKVEKNGNKKNRFYFQELEAKNGSWIRIDTRTNIENNTQLKVGLQNFLKFKIKASFRISEDQRDPKWRQNTINQQIALKSNKIHPALIANKDFSICAKFTFGHEHIPKQLFISIPCGHVYCSGLQQENKMKNIKDGNNNMLKRVCPYCEYEATSYQIEIDNWW